jgi:predicted neutral ceramidase superfamily lipid hydrolase
MRPNARAARMQNMPPNFNQILLQRLMGSEGGLTYAVYLVSMFAVMIWRRESIVNFALFRVSYLLFAAAVVLPPVIFPFLPAFSQGNPLNADGQILISLVTNGIGPLLFAAAVVCGLGSMMPAIRYQPPTPTQPQKHPLD